MIDDILLCLCFLTRLPVSLHGTPGPGALARAMRFFSLIGGGIGLAVGGVYALCHWALPAWPSALLALLSGILLTGGLHEDGLADCCDGFGGGNDAATKLAIMRDSRIGSYGALALGFSLTLRVAALAALDHSLTVIASLVAAHSLARAALPVMMTVLPAASAGGVAAEAGRPTAAEAGPAVLIALALSAILLPSQAVLAAVLAVAIIVTLIAALARRQIGGYSGDVLGAAEQGAEIAALLAILAVLRP